MARASQYGRPPLEVSQGGVFTTRTCAAAEEPPLLAANEEVIAAMGLVRGVAHTEFIRAHEDGRIYFLETAARVGGAGVADMVAAATGINMWAEWAKVEIAGPDGDYTPPMARADHAGLIVSLARQEYPDTSAYTDPEIVWRMSKRHHVGFIVRSADYGRVTQLLAALADRTQHDFNAVLPPRDRPSS